jgi:hypothetical protein
LFLALHYPRLVGLFPNIRFRYSSSSSSFLGFLFQYSLYIPRFRQFLSLSLFLASLYRARFYGTCLILDISILGICICYLTLVSQLFITLALSLFHSQLSVYTSCSEDLAFQRRRYCNRCNVKVSLWRIGLVIMSYKLGLYSRISFLVSLTIILVFPPRTLSPVPWARIRHPPMHPSGMLLPVSITAPTDP